MDEPLGHGPVKFDILPHQGAGDVRFGMHRDAVRALSAEEPRAFLRAPTDAAPCDYFASVGLFAHYSIDGVLEAVELTRPAHACLNNIDLLGLAFDQARTKLLALDDQSQEEVDSVIAHDIGIGIYAPLAKSDRKAPIESVIVFGPGYYGRNA